MNIFSLLAISIPLYGLSMLSMDKPIVGRATAGSWETLFDGVDPSKHWTSTTGEGFPKEGWAVEQGLLRLVPGRRGGDIISRRTYSDFILEIDFKLDKNANTGLKYFVSPLHTNSGKVELNGPEYQMIDDIHHESVAGGISPTTQTGSVYLLYAPAHKHLFKGHGRWNTAKIVAQGGLVEHWLNGVKIVSYNRHSAAFRSLVGATKFALYTSNYGGPQAGHIMLTDHHDGAYFKNIRIKRL